MNGVVLSIVANDIDGIKMRWQKNDTLGNFVIVNVNPFGDSALILFGYKDSVCILLFILHEKGDPERSPEIPILASVLSTDDPITLG